MGKLKRYNTYQSVEFTDLKELLNTAASKYGNSVAFREMDKYRNFIDRTFLQTKDEVNALGTKLLVEGYENCHVAIMSENRYAWVLSYLTVINGIGVAVPLDKELLDSDVALQVTRSDCEIIICSKTYLPMMQRVKERCPSVKKIISMDKSKDPEIPYIFDLVDDGAELMRKNRAYVDKKINPDALTEIIFTSGTTGANKGVMLTHKNICHVLYGAFSLIKTKKVNMSVLPISHSFECSCHILGTLYAGIMLCFCENLRYVSDRLQTYKPDMVLMVPLMLETVQKQIISEMKRRKLYNHYKAGVFWSGILRKFGIDLRRKLFESILVSLGGNLEQVVCGGAPLKQETVKFYDQIGITVINGYGISECAPLLSANSTEWQIDGSVGLPIPGTDIRISKPDDEGIGEIHAKGPNVFMGYYKDTESTKATFTDDGWFDTGDLGYLDKNGILYITGRKKNLIIFANGKNVSPEEIEEHIEHDLEYVKEVVVYPDDEMSRGNPIICAAIFPDFTWMEEHGVTDVEEKINEDIKKVNQSLPGYKKVSRVVVRDTEFEKTTTKKIKRAKVLNN